jgi:hypothetical protein
MRKSIISTLALLAVTALALPAISETFSKSVTFTEALSVSGTQVKAGDYKVVVDGTNVTIQKGHDVIVKTEGRVEQRNAKFYATTVVHDASGAVREIDLGGRNEAIVFGGGAPASGSQK